jgi:hypothetical protein
LGPTHLMSDVGHPPQYQCQCPFSLRVSLADYVGHVQAPKTQSLGVFTSVVVIVCVGALVVTIQAKVSTGQCCICDPSRLMPLSASRRQGVRPIQSLVGFLF